MDSAAGIVPTVGVSRRQFVKGAITASAFTLLPSYGADGDKAPPSERVNLACVGIGGRGGSLTKTFQQSKLTNLVAFCDVNLESRSTAEVRKLFPKVPCFGDFRAMFDAMGDGIDAVSVAIPDHAHFPVTMQAISLGKHVYVEKPLAQTFREAELIMECARRNKVATQMGNQGHSGANYFQYKAWTEAGVIKDVTKVVAYMNAGRRWHGWQITGYPEGEQVPAGLNWDEWLAARPFRPYSSKLHPGNWRGWFEFGNGAFGDWGPHILDTTHRFLKLGLPREIEAVRRDGPNPFIFPQASTVRFGFAARENMPPVDVFWYDGTKNTPERPAELEEERRLGNAGKIIYSKDLVFQGGSHSSALRVIPEAKMREVINDLPKITGKNSGHTDNFLLGCKGEEECRSTFDVSGPLTQVFLLGVIAQRLGGKLTFDVEKKAFVGNDEANALLAGPPPRQGWEQYYTL
ncbi:MAG: Gfo/Idh/MocA family oxidoreductase [Lentisphaeria bacterium]|nr:Gfo/Idh/MocA family oxidoreductase [Lentisphaeria bacterium]